MKTKLYRPIKIGIFEIWDPRLETVGETQGLRSQTHLTGQIQDRVL